MLKSVLLKKVYCKDKNRKYFSFTFIKRLERRSVNFEFFFIMDWVGKRTAVSILSVVLFLWNWLRERNILTSNLISYYCIRYTYVMYFLIRTRKGGSKRTLKNFFFFTKKLKIKKRKEIFPLWSGRKFPI